jgi:nitric oxide reductase NorD protein
MRPPSREPRHAVLTERLHARTRRLRRTLTRTLARVQGARADGAPADVPEPVTLDAVRRRLELVVGALHGRPLRVEAAVEPPPAWWVWRLLGLQRAAPVLATHAGDVIRLPRTLALTDPASAVERWRLLALGQAERIVRGGAALLVDVDDRLERALFALREGAAVDRAIARRVRTLRPALLRARAEALAARPPLELSPAAERDVERLVRAELAADPMAEDAEDPRHSDDAAASLAWARATAERLRAVHGRVFRAVLPVAHWGVFPETDAQIAARAQEAVRGHVPMPDVEQEGVSRDARRDSRALDVSDAESRTARPDAPEPAPDGRAAVAVAGHDQPSDPETSGEQPPPMPDVADDDPWRRPRVAPGSAPSGGTAIVYPEWDADAGRHRPHGATVLVATAPDGDGAWADTVLRAHAALVRGVRERFAPLRARRARLPRQRQGDELDLAACVETLADRAAGHSGDERLYVASQAARRPLAIALLVDVSGSTDARVSEARDDTRQIIDVEKEAVLLAGEALDALGDPFTVLTFSSRGAHRVQLHVVKAFAERHDATVRRRVSAMRPAGNTRLGAAVRHASALLARQPAGHRLLLLLSDGRPNDMDGYQGRYAVEDARQAVHEARAQGVFPFCLTVDREESEYLSHIFGAAGHTVLRRPDQLPLALVRAVRQLLGAGAR